MSELAKKTYANYHKNYRESLEKAMPYGTMLETARKKREEAQKLENELTTTPDVSTERIWTDWRKDREKITKLKNEAEAAEQAASAYSAMMRQEGAKRLPLNQLEYLINAPGADKDPNIGYYRTAYDQKKSRQETKNLPQNVINLLDRYNAEDTNATVDAYSSIVAAMTGQKTGRLYTSGARKAQIGQELERMGYSNYKDLAAYRKYITDAETNEKTQKEFENFAKDHPAAAAASARLLSPTATITGFGGWVKNNLNGSPLQSPNTKGADFQLSRAKNAIDDTVSNSFEDGKLSKKTKAFLYQTGMSGIDSLTASLLGKSGGALLGAGALVDSYIDASDKGASKNQAFWSSALSGIAESLFESVSIGRLNAMKEIAPRSLRDIIKNIGKSTLTNFSEEAATEVANILSDYLVNGGISDYQQQVNDKLRAGYSKEEAKKSTFLSMGKRVLEAGAGGALMGAAFGSVGSVSGKINYESQLKERGKSLSEYGGEEKLLASAYQFGTDGDEKLSKAANAVEQNRNELFRKTEEYEINQADTIQTQETRNNAKQAVEQRLTELGEKSESINGVAEAAIKVIAGEKLSTKEKAAIENSRYGQRVLNEIEDAEKVTDNTASGWAEGLSDSLKNTVETQKTENVKNKAKRPEYTRKELRQIGKLEEALAEHTEETAKGSVKMAVEDRLTELGESKENIEKVTQAAVKAASGEELSARDERAINKSRFGKRVMNEIADAMSERGAYSSNWAADMKNDVDGIYDVFSSPDIDAYRNRGAYEGESAESRATVQQNEAGTSTNGTERFLKRTDMSEETLKTMDELREDGQDREAFEKSFEAFYSMGKSGYSEEEAARSQAAAASDFSDFQKQAAFELGKAAREVQNQVKLSSISKIGENDTLVLDENGNEVSLFEVNADRGVKLLFNKAAKLRDVEAANAFLGGYETGMEVIPYEESFRSFNAAGKQNQNISFEQFMSEHKDYEELFNYIKPETAYAAFETGAQYAALNSTEQPKKSRKKAKTKGSYTNNTTAAETDAVFEAAAKKLGVQIVKEESLWSEDGREANAQFIPSQMKILISSQAQSEFTDTIHELGHLAESYNGEKMASVRGALFSWYVDKNGYSSLEDMIGKFQEDYGTSRENAIEEMTNEALSGIFSTDEGVNDFLNWLKEDSGYSKAEKKSVLQRIIEFFDRIVEAVKQTIKDGDLSQTAREFAQMQADKAAQIREMFLDALDGIDGKKRKNTAEETKNSIAPDFETKYDNWDKKDSTISFKVGTTSNVLKQLGVDVKTIFWDSSKILKIKRDHPAMKDSVIKQVPKILENPILVMRSLTDDSRLTLFGEVYDTNNVPVLAVLELNAKSKKGTSVDIIKIASAYGKDNNLQSFIDRSQILYINPNKKRTRSWFVVNRLQLPLLLTNSGFVNSSLSQNDSDVNKTLSKNITDSEVKNSLKRTDSEGTKNSRKKSYVSRDGHFLSYRETGGSDAHEQALRWAARNSVEDGDRRLAYCKEAWYIIEKDSNDYAGYQVLERIRKGEYDNERRRVEEYNRRNKRRTVSGEFAEYDFGSEQRVRYGDERYGFDINGTGYETKSGRVLSVDRSSSQRGKARIESGQNTFGGNENRTGTGTERLTDSEVKNSLKQTDRDKAESTQSKKRLYNESDTLFMQWSNSQSTPVGKRKVFKRGKEWVLFEKTEDGCIELFRGKYKTEVLNYGKTYTETNKSYDGYIEEIGADNGRNLRDLLGIGDEGNADGFGSQTESGRLQSDTGRSRGHLLSGDGRISDITDSEETKNSLRHSLGISDNTAEESLVAQNEEYRKLIGELQTQLGKRHFVDTKKVQTLAKVIKEDYRSTIRTDELTDMLGSFYSSIANNKGLSWDVVKIKTREIAEAVVSKSKNMTEISEKSRSVINDIRSVAIKLSDEQKAEVASYYGSYNNFRRSTFGTLKIRNDGISLDQRFLELSETYPYIFSKETADVDQPTALFEAAKALKNGYFDGENRFDRDSAVDFLAADIYEKYFEIPDSKSLEDDYRLKLNAEKVKLRRQLEKAKAQIKEENDIALRAARAEYAENLSDIRDEYDEKFLQNKARYEQRVQKIADTNTRAQQRKAIIRKVKRFSNMLLKTSTKGGYVGEKDGRKLVIYNNIPEELRKPVAALCEIFADDNSVFDFEKLDELKSSYATIRANTPAEETYLSGIYDADIEEELERLKKTISGKRLAQLSQRQLGTIKNILDHFDAMIKNETEIFVNGRTRQMKEIGTKTLSELKAKGKKRQRQLGKLQNSADRTKKFAVNNLKPVYFFEKVGGEFKTLYWDLHKGQDKYVRNIVAAENFIEKTVEKFGADKWLKENDKATFTTVRKEKLALTLEQRLLIYATAKREQLSGQNSLHLMSGGVVFENQIQRNKDKTKPWKFRDEDAQAHPLALEDIIKIVGSLTESQKKFADELVGYLSGDMAQLGNEVSMKLYGYRKFNERYYIPFNSAQSFGFQRFGEQGESLLRSLSFTKQTVRGAATPLVLSDFTEVVAKHIERMSAYNALVVPLENMGKVWNFKTVTSDSEIGASVASQFETAFGKEYRDYFVQFVKDVNGNVMSDSREEVYNSFLRKFKKSAVFASASVTIQQPSAICRAFAEVNPIYFAASTFDSRKSYDECMKYAPIAQLKEIGGFDTSSGRNMVDFLLEAKNQPKGKEKFKAFFTDSDFRDNVLSAAPGLADRLTWAHIWNAVKRETKAKTGLSGERLLEKAGERFTEVIEKTQVYDSVLTRSGNMRSKSGAMQTVTAFMAEPTTTVNMLYDAAINARQDPKKFFRVYSSVLCATLFNAALKSIITATRDDDEEKTNLEKYIAQVVGNFMNDLNPATLIPFVRDICSRFTGYDVSRSDVDMVSNLVDAIKKCTLGDKVPLDKKITGLAGALGDFLGIPAKNIIRDIYSVKTAVKDIKAPGKTTAKGIKFAIQAEIFPSLKNLNLLDEASRKEKLYEAWLDKDAETYERLAKSYKSGTAIKDALTDEIKNDYLDGTITAEKAEELLSPFFDEKNEAYYKIREWDDGEEESEEEEDKNSGFYQLGTAKVKPKEKKKKEKTTNILLEIQGKDAEVKDEEEDSDEPYAKFTYLEEAVKASDAAAFKKEAADLRKHGISQDTIEAKTKTYLKNDNQVVAAGKRYAKGDVSALDESERIAQKYGIEKRTVQAAIRSVAGIKTYSDSLTNGTDNIYADMHTAIAAKDNEAAAEIAGELIKAKIAEDIAEGKSADKAKNDVYHGVRSSIASNWKEAYLKASSTERAEIRASLYATGAYESLYALDKTLANWRNG